MTSHHMAPHHTTSHHITPHYTTLHHITAHHITSHHIAPQPKLAILLCPLDCVCGVGVWVVCVLCLCCVFRFVVCIVRVLGSVVCVFRVVSVVCGLVSRRHQSRLCRLVAVALCLCFLCVMRFLVHTSAWNNKRGLVAYFVVWGVFRFFGMVIVCSVRVCCVHW